MNSQSASVLLAVDLSRSTPNSAPAVPSQPSLSQEAELEKLIGKLTSLVAWTHVIERGYSNLEERRKHIRKIEVARSALLQYLADRTLTAEELGHIRWATRAAGLNEDIAGPIIEKLRRWSSPPAATEEEVKP